MSEKNTAYGLALLGALLAVGLIAASFVLGTQFKNFRQPGAITVKGLAERHAQSDQVTWATSVNVHSDTYQGVLDAINTQRPVLHEFLQSHGFEKDEIQTGVPEVNRRYRTERDQHGNFREVFNGYEGKQTVTVAGNKLEQVAAAHKAILSLRARNEAIGFTAPQYLIGNLETIKRELITQATDDAHKRALEFAKTGGGKVGAMRSASQGSFNIYADNGSSENDDYGGTYDKSTVGKQVRLVVTIEYGIE